MAKRRRYIGGGFCQDDFKSQRARQKPPKALLTYNNQSAEAFPANPSTRVHELVRSIHGSLPAAMKDRFPLD